jgi:hypothetical protein
LKQRCGSLLNLNLHFHILVLDGAFIYPHVSRCPHCGSDLEIIAAVLDPKQIARYLKHTGMPAAPPARAGVKMRVANDEWC